MNDVDLEKYGKLVEYFAHLLQRYSWVIVVLPGTAWLANYFQKRLEANWVRFIIKSTLTQFCDRMFSDLAGGKDEHRATLFAYKKFAFRHTLPWSRHRLPWSGWLVPIARSGHATQSVKTRFLAPDKAARAEGVAGLTWRNRATVTVTDLPLIASAAQATDIQEYCSKTKIAKDWLEMRLAAGDGLPRSLRGIPIEVDNELWGVIVLDSKDPSPFAVDPDGQGPLTRMFTFTISKLLERAPR